MKYLKLTMVFIAVCFICGCGNQDSVIKVTENKGQEELCETEILKTEVSDNLSAGYYHYPDITDMRAAQICEACRIPEDTLDRMSSEQLAQAVADFPLLSEVMLTSSTEYDVDWLKEKSDAYRELLSRKDAKDVLIEKSNELAKEPDNEITVDLLKKVILHEKNFQEELTESEKEYLEN